MHIQTLTVLPFIRHARASARTGLVRRLRMAMDIWRQRRALARMDARALNDIGVSPKSAAREAKKPVWDVPSHWLR